MKKLTIILLALMTIVFTQCKPESIDNTDSDTNTDTRKVKVRCEIPLGNGSRSDFTNFLTDGSIKWSTGTERIYLAVHHADASKAQIVELTALAIFSTDILAFEGKVAEDILTDGATYNVWYLGNSMNLETTYVTKTEEAGMITKIDGSIANQSGSLEDLGYHHIAKAEVTATQESDGSFTLPLNGTLQNQMAIACLDLTDVNSLSGSAIIGTDYSLKYSNGEYKFVVSNTNKEITIVPNHSKSASESFVVLLPNARTNVDIMTDNYYKYTFNDGIAVQFYYRYISDVEVGTLKWEYHPFNNGHELVDLGLPSGLKWATCNVGADSPEAYGNYYAWGMTTTPPDNDYNNANCVTYGKSIDELKSLGYIDESGILTPSHDVATTQWGTTWRMPTKAELDELENNCIWEWTTQNGVGCKVTGSNGNSIFLPAAGYRYGSSLSGAGSYGYYWSSTPIESDANDAWRLYFHSGIHHLNFYYRFGGQSVRPVSE